MKQRTWIETFLMGSWFLFLGNDTERPQYGAADVNCC